MNVSGNILLKKGREQSVLRKHPWVFSGALQQLTSSGQDGNWVKVCDSKGLTLGFGHYQNGSIAVRMLSFGEEQPADTFWKDKINRALTLRHAVGLPSEKTNAFRLIHGEGDGLPGLIIDFYAGVAVIQAHSAGMHNDREQIAQALKVAMGEQLSAIYYKSRATLPGKIKEDQPDGYLLGMGVVPHVIHEHGNKFLVDWESGQKTGFFLDQRENRKLLGDFSKGKNVLNTFCYTGGFSVYALKADASLVHSVDASEKAIDITRKNIELNGYDPQQHECTAIDTFEFLKNKQGVYDLIVLDPPAFAKHRDARHQAVKGYQRLNAEAMKVIRPGGIIFTFSCSQVVDKQLFYDTVTSAAIQAEREVKVLHLLSQPSDHPVSMNHPEGEYLKGLVLYVV
ncbi:MAG TPA: class I SAM-dependent rRNA methyltransferase [Cyclobacteriaceae bacterium]|nr:class I SAM-dependent rRNA methyltransferase [Cyclobacteriaceae bacterium]HRJ80447.1 class I SAM-dependent rRNA methyltransferase [Cyclobacteriaceae bacterium]